MRWLNVAGKVGFVLVWTQVLGQPAPLLLCMALIGLAILVNLGVTFSPLAQHPLGAWEITGLLVFDVIELGVLLYLTGGLLNPFCLFLFAPATLAASLPRRNALGIALLAAGAVVILGVASPPPGWAILGQPNVAGLYGWVRALALVTAILGGAGYAHYVAREESRMQLALHITETVLAREQRLSALGALAAAAAHELGTPLATISVVARELARECPDGPMRDDALLMVAQAQRCRDILRRLTDTPDTGDAVHERMSFLQLVREILEPYAGAGPIRAEAVVTGPPGMAAPDLWRRPEIVHAVTSIVDNAFDFARAEILLTGRFDAQVIAIEISDDGPGFSAEILARLGEPYVTSRPAAEGSRTGHVGMGLGLFIAKTLLERTGAEVTFRNVRHARHRHGGAIVTAKWPRARMEAVERRGDKPLHMRSKG